MPSFLLSKMAVSLIGRGLGQKCTHHRTANSNLSTPYFYPQPSNPLIPRVRSKVWV